MRARRLELTPGQLVWIGPHITQPRWGWDPLVQPIPTALPLESGGSAIVLRAATPDDLAPPELRARFVSLHHEAARLSRTGWLVLHGGRPILVRGADLRTARPRQKRPGPPDGAHGAQSTQGGGHAATAGHPQ